MRAVRNAAVALMLSLLLAILLLVIMGFLKGLSKPETIQVRAGDGCYQIPITPNTPTGIAGCWREGEGIASHFGPGGGVAMNFCTWKLRHTFGCGWVTVTSSQSELQVTVPVVDFCDCYTGTPDERIIDLQYDVVTRLGLTLSTGLYPVTVERANQVSPQLLPNTAMEH